MWRTQSGRATVLALVLLASVTSEGRSQAGGGDPTAAQVAISLRTKGHPRQARAVLTQARGPRSAHQMDEVADTLVSIAATFPGDDLRGVSTRSAALMALVHAGRGSSGIDDGSGVRYAGAAARLKRLAETAQGSDIRAGALLGLVQLPDSVAYFPFLGKVAASQTAGEEAQAAATLLVNDLGPAGRAIARELYLAGRVTQSSARITLDGAAQQFGWRRP
ncbi:MAG: hypothetical protein Q8K82_17555 [Gemmatimonadaceae bacterium]|nr:hypothetical protein [Gemmatimonadaceae bacterium]